MCHRPVLRDAGYESILDYLPVLRKLWMSLCASDVDILLALTPSKRTNLALSVMDRIIALSPSGPPLAPVVAVLA